MPTYEKEVTRVASSKLSSLLFDNTEKYQAILAVQKEILMKSFPDQLLDSMFSALDSRIINICPMALCDTLLRDLGRKCPNSLLAGIGLSMFSISTHDDLVDELPRERSVIAALTYAGNISTLEGISLLIRNGHIYVVPTIIDCINKNHYYQTKIVKTLWENPHDEEGYLDAIKHTGYWVAIGLNAAIKYAKRPDLQAFVDGFSMCYGLTCQIFDDMREIDDDIENGYWSLPISIAKRSSFDLASPNGRNQAISRPREIAMGYLTRAKELSRDAFPNLFKLVLKIEQLGCAITY